MKFKHQTILSSKDEDESTRGVYLYLLAMDDYAPKFPKYIKVWHITNKVEVF